MFLKALGLTSEQILEEFKGYPSIELTLEKDAILTKEEALKDIYRKLRPGEQVAAEAARALLDNFYFNPKRYDLAKVGRYKINRKLGLDGDMKQSVLTIEDIIATIKYLVSLHDTTSPNVSATENGIPTIKGVRDGKKVDVRLDVDDIDHFGNRRIRAVGELIQNQVRTGLSRMERVVRERMTTQDIEAITPQTLINVRPVVAAIKEFFGTSQLSQFMDQNNPLAGLTHKRRLSALGPGGLSRERAGVEVRDVHPSHYGRMCPIETPEGPNIGLIGSLASFARINAFGFIETPYRRVVNGKVTDKIDYLTAIRGGRLHRRPGQRARSPRTSHFADPRVLARKKGGEVDLIPTEQIGYMDVSPRQMVSVATSLIPFLEHDDANRALMGANMQRQAVPLLRCESRRSSAPAWRASRPSTPATCITADKAGVCRRGLGRPRRHPARRGWNAGVLPAQVRPLEPGHVATTTASSSARATASSRARSSRMARRRRTASSRSARTSSSRSCRGRVTTSKTRSS